MNSFPTQQLIDDLRIDEGFESKPYRDTEGFLTIGIGRNLDAVGISEDEALLLLWNDIEKARTGLFVELPWVGDLPTDQQQALVNMTFQMGVHGVLKFKNMLKALQTGDLATAEKEAYDSLWARQTPNRAKKVISQLVGK